MSVLALVTKSEEVKLVTTWACEFAAARDTTLTVLCWARSPMVLVPKWADNEEADAVDELVAEVHCVIAAMTEDKHGQRLPLPADKIDVHRTLHPDAIAATLEQIRVEDPELVVAAAEDHSGRTGATYATNRLLRQSPCNTIILFGNRQRSARDPRIFVGTVDNPHDVAAVHLAARMAEACETHVTMARAEQESGEQAIEIGHRELRQLMRDAGVKRNVGGSRPRLRLACNCSRQRRCAATDGRYSFVRMIGIASSRAAIGYSLLAYSPP